jgi:L-asparaginase II
MTGEALHAADGTGKVNAEAASGPPTVPPAGFSRDLSMNDTRRPLRSAPSTGTPGGAVPANPVLVQVSRGTMVESRHRGAVAIVDHRGAVVHATGDIEQVIYPRSAIKPLQALLLVESGAAEAVRLGDAEIALACASHSGEIRHVDAVRAWLDRIGLKETDLECGPQLPRHESSARALLRQGASPRPVHNNCSGKHAGFLTVAKHLGVPTRGYIRPEHPVQQQVLRILEEMCGLDLAEAPRGVDGCGIPVVGIPLGNLALAMARFGWPSDQPGSRQAAAARIRRAMAAEPFMVAGSGRFCTAIMQVTGERAIIKTGAEGVFCACVPDQGLGIALKIDDGAGRAAEVAMGRVLRRLQVLGDQDAKLLADFLRPTVTNMAGRQVGHILACADWII